MAATTAVLVETSIFLWLLEISTGEVITNKETLLVETSLDNVFMTWEFNYVFKRFESDQTGFHQSAFHRYHTRSKKLILGLVPGVILMDNLERINDSICLILYFSYSKKGYRIVKQILQLYYVVHNFFDEWNPINCFNMIKNYNYNFKVGTNS